MPLLSARFTIDVSSPCLLEVPSERERPQLSATFGDFRITVTLVPAQHWRQQQQGAALWTTGLEQLVILASREEPEGPPEVIVRDDGTHDLSVQGMYLFGKLDDYKVVAREAANRVLRYFRDQLLTPSVRLFPEWTQALSSPLWLDASGNELRGGGRVVVAQPVPGGQGEFGIRKLDPEELPSLNAFLTTPIEPTLGLTLLSDAQTAWFEGNLRRAVLELAICAEVLVKRKFFSASTPAGAAFDYLEDKAKVSVRVLELLDTVATEAFGQSYKRASPTEFDCIDRLFRCRNKIAHRGELSYREDSGVLVTPDAPAVERWWNAVAHLRTWLQTLT